MFRDFSYAKQIQQYHGAPIEEMRTLGDKLELRYQTNLDTQDKLEQYIDSLDVRDVNRPHVMKAYENAKNRLAKIREGGNWEDAEHDVRLATKEFSADKDVRGALSDKASYDAWLKDLEERYKAEKIAPDTYKLAKQYSMETNAKAVEYDPKTGSYKNIFSGYSPQNFQNIQKAMFEMGEKFKASTRPIPLEYQDANGNIVKKDVKYDQLKGYFVIEGSEHERLTEAELQSGLTMAALANPMYKGYMQEQLMFDKYQKFGAGTERARAITFDDLINNDPTKGALLDMTEDEARKYLTEAGFDYDKMKADPLAAEALYDQIKLMKIADGYIKPAAMAYSYEKIDRKFLTDNVMMEALKHANELDKQRKQHEHDREMAAQKRAWELEDKPDLLQYSNNFTTTPGDPDFSLDTLEVSTSNSKGRLKVVERAIEDHKLGKGKGNINELLAERDQLKTQIASQEGLGNLVVQEYLNTEEGQKELDRMWKNPNTRKAYKTKEDLKKAIAANDKPGFRYTSSTAPVSTVQPLWDAFASTPEADFKSIRNNASKHYATTGTSVFGKVLDGEKGTVQHRSSELLTNHVNNHLTDYTVAGGGDLSNVLNKLVKERGEELVVTDVKMQDGEAFNGMFPQSIVIRSKKTGEKIKSLTVFPKSGGADIRIQVGEGMMKQSDKDESFYYQGAHMAATGLYTNFNTRNVLSQLSSVSSDSPEGAVASSTPFSIPGNGGQVTMKMIAKRVPVYDPKTYEKIGVNTRYFLAKVDSKGNPIQYVPNPNIAPQPLSNNNVQSNSHRIQAQSHNEMAASFASVDDARVALYFALNPNAGKIPKNIVGYSESNTTYKSTTK